MIFRVVTLLVSLASVLSINCFCFKAGREEKVLPILSYQLKSSEKPTSDHSGTYPKGAFTRPSINCQSCGEMRIPYGRLNVGQPEQVRLLEKLQQEIVRNPEAKHRIILKAIKTAKSRATQKAIREFFKEGFR